MPTELLLLAFEACQRLLELLENDTLRQVAIWKLAGYTNEAIRIQLGCSLATVERTLAHIRETWRRKWDTVLTDRPAKSGRRDFSDDHDHSLTGDWLNGITAAGETRSSAAWRDFPEISGEPPAPEVEHRLERRASEEGVDRCRIQYERRLGVSSQLRVVRSDADAPP